MTEFDLIGRIKALATSHPAVRIGIGDDCAALRVSAGAELLVTTDMLMDGRHFRLDEAGSERVGYKALAVNLSDVAAMAGTPVAAFVAVALPWRNPADLAEGLLRGMAPLAERFGVALAGGDTNAWDGPLVVCITLLGESNPPGPVTRGGAEVGDVILVTGPLGGSLLGRHLEPLPRIAEAIALQRAATLHAMIDLSDGLASDLGHILEASGGLGAILDADAIPIHPDARTLAARDGRGPLDHALNDGEDFELCLTLGAAQAQALVACPPSGVWLQRVGVVTDEPGQWLVHGDGSRSRLIAKGFDHLRPSSGVAGTSWIVS